MKKLLRFLLIVLWASSGVRAQDIPPQPNPPRLVNDFAQQLSAGERAELERKLVAYNDSTSNQIVVVIVPTTEPYAIGDYAFELGRKWGVGQQGKNNGLVILWAPKDRKVFIATGYGMEGAIPDAIAKRIVSDVIIPEFKENRFYRGLDRGVDEVIKYASGEYKAEPGRNGGGGFPTGVLVFIVVFVIMLIVIARGKGGGGGNRGRGRGFRTGGGPVIFPYDTYSGWGRSSGSWGGGGSGGGFGGFGGGSFGGGGAGGNY